jgi:hypothetical protein
MHTTQTNPAALGVGRTGCGARKFKRGAGITFASGQSSTLLENAMASSRPGLTASLCWTRCVPCHNLLCIHEYRQSNLATQSSIMQLITSLALIGNCVSDVVQTDIPYRYQEQFLISRAYITTYAGGSVESLFAPSQDQYIW